MAAERARRDELAAELAARHAEADQLQQEQQRNRPALELYRALRRCESSAFSP